MDDLINKEVKLYLDNILVSQGKLLRSIRDEDYYMVDSNDFYDWLFTSNQVIDISGNKIFIKFP